MALTFNGTSAKLQVDTAPVTAYPFSIFAWIKPTNPTVSGMAVGIGNGSGGNEVAAFADGVNGVKNFSRLTGGSSTSLTATTSQQASWQPCLVVFESTTSRRIYYSSGAVVLTTISTSDASPGTFTRMVVGARPTTGSTLYFTGDIAEVAVWSSALGQTDFDSLAGDTQPETVATGSLVDAWSLVTYNAATQTGVNARVLTVTGTSQAGSHPITRVVPAVVAGTITLDDFTLSGDFATGALSQLSSGLTLDAFALSGFLGLAPGRIDTSPFKNWTGTLLPGVTIPRLTFLRLSDMTTVLQLTNQVTAGDGVLTVTNAAFTPGTTYLVVAASVDGTSLGAEIYTAT